MIGVAALFALIAALATTQPAATVEPIVVRVGNAAARRLAVRELHPGARYLGADELARALGGTAEATPGGADRVRIRLRERTFEFTAASAFARVDTEIVPLAFAPERIDRALFVPLQVATDLIPRLARGIVYDAEHRELRGFAVVASKPAVAQPTVARTPTVAVAPPPMRSAPPSVQRLTPIPGRHGRVVVVDAGHGGRDTGMHGPLGGDPQIDEKDVTLGIAQRLRAALAARGVSVVMTRTRDTLVALADRGRIANEQQAELFISIHVNAANPAWHDAASARGFETYFLAEAKSEDARRVATRENESIQYESAAPQAAQDPLRFILSDMAQNEHLRESSRLATIVQRSLIGVHPGPSRGVKQAGFKVLVTASMPAVLVEVGYGTNPADATYIASEAGQRALATAIANAAVVYLSRSEHSGLAARGAP